MTYSALSFFFRHLIPLVFLLDKIQTLFKGLLLLLIQFTLCSCIDKVQGLFEKQNHELLHAV